MKKIVWIIVFVAFVNVTYIFFHHKFPLWEKAYMDASPVMDSLIILAMLYLAVRMYFIEKFIRSKGLPLDKFMKENGLEE